MTDDCQLNKNVSFGESSLGQSCVFRLIWTKPEQNFPNKVHSTWIWLHRKRRKSICEQKLKQWIYSVELKTTPVESPIMSYSYVLYWEFRNSIAICIIGTFSLGNGLFQLYTIMAWNSSMLYRHNLKNKATIIEFEQCFKEYVLEKCWYLWL